MVVPPVAPPVIEPVEGTAAPLKALPTNFPKVLFCNFSHILLIRFLKGSIFL